MKKVLSVILFFSSLEQGINHGNVKLPGIFTDNMVLQRAMCMPLWGWADPGELIKAEIDGYKGETMYINIENCFRQ